MVADFKRLAEECERVQQFTGTRVARYALRDAAAALREADEMREALREVEALLAVETWLQPRKSKAECLRIVRRALEPAPAPEVKT